MATVIDGYNLIYELGWLTRRNRAAGALERARERLLSFLVNSLDEKTAASTTVVFDAAKLPPDAARVQQRGPVRVLFADRYSEADALIEELIRESGTPKELTVVSSDRRLIMAAKRRRATPLRSEEWYQQVVQAREERSLKQVSQQDLTKRGDSSIPPEELDFWLKKFT